jgi:hypothetical protein
MGMCDLRDFLRGALPASDAQTLDRFCEAVDGRTITVSAVSNSRETGMHLTRNGLEWRLLPGLAEDFAAKVDALASCVEGHQYLDADGNAIAVEVSIGEYPESLHPDPPAGSQPKASNGMI